MCKRKLTIEQEYEIKEKYENGCAVKDLAKEYGFKQKKSIYDIIEWCKRVFENYYRFIPLNLLQGDNGVWYIRTSDDRNIMLLYVHIYYSQFGMKRKREKLLKRFRDYNGRD